ncbi:MAG: RlmE family RNA methyltransferase [Methanocellales archaeon]
MPRRKKDFYYFKAKEEGYRSRAAYKLKRINERFKVIKKGDVVVDLGAAPGGWLQVAKEISGGRVIGVDLQAIEPMEGVETIRGDLRAQATINGIMQIVEKVDTVLCDASPDLSGIWSLDHARSIDLANAALEAAKKLLRLGGNFVVKVFQGDMYEDFLNTVKKNFTQVRAYKSEASRKESAEIYIVAKGFKA